MNKSKVLIVDTNYAVIPLIEFLKQNGYKVGITGRFCAKSIRDNVDVFHKVDYARTAKLRDVIDKYGYEHVIPGCTDLSYLQCSNLERTEVDDAEIIKVLHEKKKFKRVLSLLKIPTSRSYSEQDVIHQKQQLIIKPIDSFSGNGISILSRNADCLTKEIAIEQAKLYSFSKEIIAEEYFQGDLYSVSSLWNGKKIVKDIYVREYGLANEFRVDYSYIDSDFSNTDLAVKIKHDLYKVARHLNLKPGILHFQFLKKDQNYVIIECMRRLPGDLYARLIEIDSDWQYGEDYVNAFIGTDIRSTPKETRVNAGRHVRMTVSNVNHRRKLMSKLRVRNLKYSEYTNCRKAPNFRSTFFVEKRDTEELLCLFRSVVNQ